MESGVPESAPECWCPCNCGCQDHPNGGDLPFTNGLCLSCTEGHHEVSPLVAISDLIAAHESILVQLRGLALAAGLDKYGEPF